MIATRDTDWRTYARERGVGSLACQPAWLDLLRRVYGYEAVPLTVADASGAVRGLLPLCRLRSPLTGRRLVSVPFSDSAPLLADDDRAGAELVDRAIALARDEGAKYLELRTGPNAMLAARSDLAASELYVRWLVPLSGGADAAWSSTIKTVQQKVRKAKRKGVVVRHAERREDMLAYHRLHVQTRSGKHGMPSQPKQFFLQLWDRFAPAGQLHLLLAEYEQTIVAGAILLSSGDTIHHAYSASDPEYLQLSPNNMLLWESIVIGCDQGFRVLDLGRTARDNEGLMQYKRGWGATPEPLTYYYFPALRGLATTSEQSWKFRLATSCWRRLPLPVADALGGRLYGHLG